MVGASASGSAARPYAVAPGEPDRGWSEGLAESTLAVAILGVDGVIERANPAFLALLGRAADAVEGADLCAVLECLEDDESIGVAQLISSETDLSFAERRHVRPDGMKQHLQIFTMVVRDGERRPLYVLITLADLTEQHRQAEDLATQTMLLERVARRDRLEDVLDGLCRSIEERAVGTRCTVLLLNPDGRTVRHGAAPSMPPEFIEAIDGSAIGPEEGSCGAAMYRGIEVVAEDIATHPYWDAWREIALPLGLRACWSTPLLSADTRPAERRVLGSFAVYWDEPHTPSEHERLLVRRTADITAIAIEREQAEQALRDASLTDSLTGLANRRRFLSRLGEALRRAGSEPSVAVLYLDLDGFKLVNDSMGHDVGDQLLKAVGARLQGVVRPDDTAARLGGDEFAIICENVSSLAAAQVLAERARGVLSGPFRVAGREIFATASVGVSVGSSRAQPARLVEDADAAMYQAKARGRARVELFDDELRAKAQARMNIETALRRALDRGEFMLHYQPVIELASGRLSAVEALLRWNSPDLGSVPPDAFIPVAEDTGMIGAIGDWVIEEACRQYEAWRQADHEMPVIAINVSPRQLADPSLVATLSAALTAHSVPVHAIRLELTETALADPVAESGVLAALSQLGVQLSVDDFGTGHSSLARLRGMAVHELKIDRSFIDGLGTDPGDSAIVSAIVRMAAELSLDVVAEGVETRTQLDELKRLDCPHVQGFLYARPAPAEAFDVADHLWVPVR